MLGCENSVFSLCKEVIDDMKEDRVNEQLYTLLWHPLNTTKLNSILSNEELDLFNSVYLPRIMHGVIEFSNKSFTEETQKILRYCTKNAKPDIWLECLINFLKTADGLASKFILQQLEEYVFLYNRLPVLFSLCLKDLNLNIHTSIDSNVRLVTRIPTYVSDASRGTYSGKLIDADVFVNTVLSSCIVIVGDSHEKYRFTGCVLTHLGLCGFSTSICNFLVLFPAEDQKLVFFANSISFIKPTAMEICIEPMIKRFPSSLLHSVVFQAIGTDNTKLNNLLQSFHHLFFVRYSNTGDAVRNLFSTLALLFLGIDDMKHSTYVLSQIDDKLGLPALRLWSNLNSIQRSSIERHIYTSQIMLSWITDFRSKIAAKLSIDILPDHTFSDFLSGVSNHLSSPRQEIRLIGMSIGEWLIEKYNLSKHLDDPLKLKFEYEHSEILNHIVPYFDISVNKAELDENKKDITHFDQKLNKEVDSDDVSDSDSDILPSLQDVSEVCDAKSDVKKPRYLRECLDALLSSKPEDNQTNIVCSMELKNLILENPFAARGMADDILRTLVHVEPPASSNSNEIISARHEALIAIGCIAPKESACYLTNDFCQTDYSIGQRLSILSALTDIACKLAGHDFPLSDEMSLNSDATPNLSISSLTKKKLLTNKFREVSGEFFFPLIQCIPQLSACSTTGPFSHQDCSLLANLIASLATMYACARYSSAQCRMAKDLLDLIRFLHKHPEPAVRRALVIAIGTVITTTPDSTLLANSEILFGKKFLPHSKDEISDSSFILNWLNQSLSSESDSECHHLSEMALSSLVERIAELGK